MSQQDAAATVRVGTVLLEVVILLHGLIVQVFSVNHEEYLLHPLIHRSQLCRLERGQRLAATRCVPDVAACLCRTQPTAIVQGLIDTAQDGLCCCYLVGAHHHQTLIYRKHTVASQDVEQHLAVQEPFGKVYQICHAVDVRVSPVGGELKGVALSLCAGLTHATLLHHVCIAGGI